MKYFQHQIKVKTPGAIDYTPILTAYIPDNSREIQLDRLRPAVLVLPGGGYFATSDRENEPVALKFAAAGICAFTLKYSCVPARFPQALCEVYAAIDYIRTNSKEFMINPDQIALCGFSAGGHLCASAGVHWDKPFVEEYLGKRGEAIKPNKLILCYAVITSDIEGKQKIVFTNLLGKDNEDSELINLLSLEKHVTPETPPSFIWHTYEDNVVPVQNALLFASRLVENGVPVELHIYLKGVHGLSLGNYLVYGNKTYGEEHMSSDWIDKAIRFIFD